MIIRGNGYSNYLFNHVSLKAKAQEIADRLPGLMLETGADAVVVTGKSGMSMGFATLMLIDFPLVVVRKGGELSHGYPVEGDGTTKIDKYLIMDDFICTGRTVINIIKAMNERAHLCGYEPDGVKCVGVLRYDARDDDRPRVRPRVFKINDHTSERIMCYTTNPKYGIIDTDF